MTGPTGRSGSGEILRGIEDRFEIAPVEGPDKVRPLEEAVRALVRPGMALEALITHARPGALMNELIRVFHGTRPGFTLIALGMGGNPALLVHAKLIRKLISTYIGDSYPTPGPNRAIQRGIDQGETDVEMWSISTLPQRLMAGAMGLPFLPTRSLAGSTMAEENKGYFTIEDPEEPGRRVGAVRALRPDLTLVHALAGDRAGNLLLTPPLGGGVYGALGAKEGVLATVERIVPTETLRRYSHFVRIPGYVVRAVCEVPFGAHPTGQSALGIPELEGYADDYDFMEDMRRATRKEETLDDWIDRWILAPRGREEYLAKLGADRILYLKGKARGDSWKGEILEAASRTDFDAPPGPVERMVAEAGRRIAERIRAEGYSTILAGIGASNLAAWLARDRLARDGVPVDLMAELGFFGYLPRPADPFIFNYRNLPTCKMLTEISGIMGTFMGGPSGRCVGSIGAAQVDRVGNVNTTRIPGVGYLLGSGGANDVVSTACETVVVANQSRKRFVERVAYITSPGERVRTVVSDLGVFEKEDGELVLTAYFATEEGSGVGADASAEDAIREVKANCGWPLKVAQGIERIPGPDPEDLARLRLYDPQRHFLGKGDS